MSDRKTSIYLPQDLLHWLRVEAAQRDTTMADIIRDVLERHRRDTEAARGPAGPRRSEQQ